MTTKNEYIASIMLEAAELLKEDASYDKRPYYSVYDSMRDTLNEAYSVINKLDGIIDYYENNWYNLNEAATEETDSKIKRAISFIVEKIKEAWNTIIGFFAGGKRVAKKNGKVADPKKASDAIDKITKECNSDDGDVNSVNTDNLDMPIKEGDPAPNYSAVQRKVDKAMRALNQNKEWSKQRDALKAIKNISDQITYSTGMFGSFEAEYNARNTYSSDKKPNIDKYLGINNGTYNARKTGNLKTDSQSNDRIKTKYAGEYERRLARHPVGRRMALNNAIELLYDQAALTENADELEIILNAIDVLENQ